MENYKFRLYFLDPKNTNEFHVVVTSKSQKNAFDEIYAYVQKFNKEHGLTNWHNKLKYEWV